MGYKPKVYTNVLNDEQRPQIKELLMKFPGIKPREISDELNVHVKIVNRQIGVIRNEWSGKINAG